MEHGGPIDVFSSVTISDKDHPERFLMEEAMVMIRAEENHFSTMSYACRFGLLAILLVRVLVSS